MELLQVQPGLVIVSRLFPPIDCLKYLLQVNQGTWSTSSDISKITFKNQSCLYPCRVTQGLYFLHTVTSSSPPLCEKSS